MGVSGSGKTTVGAALAQRLRVPFADADDFHPRGQHRQDVGRHAARRRRPPPLARRDRRLAGRPHAERRRDQLLGPQARLPRPLRTGAARVVFLHLDGSREVIAAGMAGRPGHFMPTSLLTRSSPRSSPSSRTRTGSSSTSTSPSTRSSSEYRCAALIAHAPAAPRRASDVPEPPHDSIPAPAQRRPRCARRRCARHPAGRLVPAALLGIARHRRADHLRSSCTPSSR